MPPKPKNKVIRKNSNVLKRGGLISLSNSSSKSSYGFSKSSRFGDKCTIVYDKPIYCF